jgi:uncharacterized protein
MLSLNQNQLSSDMILDELRKQREILDRFGVKRIGIFGSYVSGKAAENSDIDFVVEFKRPDIDLYLDLMEYLEILFQRKIDLITPAGIESIRIGYIKDSITKNAIYV